MRLHQREYGVGLLELVLSITVVAVIILAGLRYFETSRQAGRVNESLTVIKAIYTAAELWSMRGLSFSDASGSSGSGSGDPLLTKFFQMGFLPMDYSSGAKRNPWGGEFKAEGQLKILKLSSSKLPSSACEEIKEKLRLISQFAIKELKCSVGHASSTLEFSVEIK